MLEPLQPYLYRFDPLSRGQSRPAAPVWSHTAARSPATRQTRRCSRLGRLLGLAPGANFRERASVFETRCVTREVLPALYDHVAVLGIEFHDPAATRILFTRDE